MSNLDEKKCKQWFLIPKIRVQMCQVEPKQFSKAESLLLRVSSANFNLAWKNTSQVELKNLVSFGLGCLYLPVMPGYKLRARLSLLCGNEIITAIVAPRLMQAFMCWIASIQWRKRKRKGHIYGDRPNLSSAHFWAHENFFCKNIYFKIMNDF